RECVCLDTGNQFLQASASFKSKRFSYPSLSDPSLTTPGKLPLPQVSTVAGIFNPIPSLRRTSISTRFSPISENNGHLITTTDGFQTENMEEDIFRALSIVRQDPATSFPPPSSHKWNSL
ncbi:hypothetical protein ACO22_04209, partial [Paracoccidioides brasiliensis]